MDYREGMSTESLRGIDRRLKQVATSNAKSVREIASAIFWIKQELKEEERWRAFCDSETLGYGSRTVQDYAVSHEWLDGVKEAKDDVLGRMSVRAMAMIATSPDEVRQELTERVLEGEHLTQAKVLEARGNETSSPTEQPSKKELAAKVASQGVIIELLEQDADRLANQRDFWRDRARDLEREYGETHVQYNDHSDDLIEVVSEAQKRRKKLVAT